MDGGALAFLPRPLSAVPRTSRASHETTTTFYTAQEYAHHSRLSLATISTYYSIDDPAIVSVTTEPELRAAFRNLDITEKITISSTTPLGIGGHADVLQGQLLPVSVSATLKPKWAQQVAIKVPRVSSPQPHMVRVRPNVPRFALDAAYALVDRE